MRYLVLILGALLAAGAVAFAQEPTPAPAPTPTPVATETPVPAGTPTFEEPVTEPSVPPDFAAIQWRQSQSKGSWARKGRLVRGVMLPELGEDFFTWDPIFNRIPNREWRRYGTDRLIRTVLTVIHQFRMEHDSAQRVGIMDLSRTHGGKFGREYGGLGHASHQNGLDIDILYPRKDGTEARPTKPSQVDRVLAQDLVDRFVAAGAIKVFVGPKLKLKGPKNVVVPLIYHDDHLHVRVR
ncbi:penicillin-insensitive murein endopeptidase [Solirubrobacter phytolaccae]|uniref:Penicillin-insensitive murein endopeptidase n=1 Tax=Solirubrobacter phytolaccae TaxID=1404360 RepID=A0A9X3NNS1_9ACTN|nr:penicillin-insensitive murein endopeptidase [Solirubrobacter phytolaccae]MDA0184827.1 penicillin-insensitive murein endopeptidase [Solirubrobacter phytolaccae]